MKSVTKIIVYTAVICGVGAAEAFAQSRPSDAQIERFEVSGDGCRLDETGDAFSPDRSELSLLFDNYKIEVGQGTIMGNVRNTVKRCNVDLYIRVPRGLQFAFVETDFRGYIDLPRGVEGKQQMGISHFPSAGRPRPPTVFEYKQIGPHSESYEKSIRTVRRTFSDCGGLARVRISSALIVNYPLNDNRFETSLLTVDSNDNSVGQSLKTVWQTCR